MQSTKPCSKGRSGSLGRCVFIYSNSLAVIFFSKTKSMLVQWEFYIAKGVSIRVEGDIT
ncbi:MAG: hypothetical protein QXV84_00450 [Conexivisphaerales archaeon]